MHASERSEVLAAASAALGEALTHPAGLGGSERSAVLRCRTAAGSTVVVKSYPRDDEGADGFTAEAAGLAFTGLALAGGRDAGPRLLAADRDARVIVMSDLGDAPSLADVLLGTDGDRARAALLDWARACGDLAVRTAGRHGDLARLSAAWRPPDAGPVRAGDPGGHVRRADDGHDGTGHDGDRAGGEHWLRRRIGQIPGLLDELSLPCPAGLDGDLAAIWDAVAPGRHDVFSPGDICPDNNLLTPGGVRFVDFESAEFHSVFLDAAYLRMPFSSCWCVFRLPARLAAEAETAYRRRVGGIFPELAGDAAWERGVRAATAAWTLHAMTYLLGRSVVADGKMIRDGRQAPTARQLLRYRWRCLTELMIAAQPTSSPGLPAVAGLADGLLAATAHWPVGELPRYPAFR